MTGWAELLHFLDEVTVQTYLQTHWNQRTKKKENNLSRNTDRTDSPFGDVILPFKTGMLHLQPMDIGPFAERDNPSRW